ncbi:class I SAM-dependent methyltransferase [Candidatus Nitrosocosmicus franklandus]|uniref:Ubiquinone/menaquinone biosynthesis C-methyltransferase UbiE n=1 Tax=Candidatus Nitrosocosmicus franklandianus TaxID=1798806 RepID=A0A484ID66_9ARCH|nr:Ubiquinone/menaquinone biosynthesis C-methyltransferase UbiE [Candidatus Nitrosocosmicus franklandus]
MIELAGIKQGSKVLDIATGIGEPSITAAQLVGENGHVLAIDISPQMLAVAKERSISLGLQDVMDFREGDAETINLPFSTIDASLCRFGLMFLPNVKAGLSNIHKSLAKDGRFVAAVWASPDKVPFISFPLEILMKETNNPPPPMNAPGPFSLSDEKLLEEYFSKSEFKDVTIERHTMIFNFKTAEEFTNFVCETASPVQVILSGQSEGRRKEILNVITEAAVNNYMNKNSDSISLKNEAVCIVGTK